MRLFVYLLEGKNWPVKDSYVKLKFGKYKSKTKVFKNTSNPILDEEFMFRVRDSAEDDDDDEEEELVLSVYEHNEDSGFFNVSGNLVGRVRIKVLSFAAGENHNTPTWFPLERPKTSESIHKDCGKILLTLSLHGRDRNATPEHIANVLSNIRRNGLKEWDSVHAVDEDTQWPAPSKKVGEGKQFMKAVAGHLEKLFHKHGEASKSDDSSELSTNPSDYEDCVEELPGNFSFEELIESMQSIEREINMPDNLQGGILLDQIYAVTSKDLNMLLFAPNSKFRRDLAEMEGTKDIQEGPWTWKSEDKTCITRVVSYTKAATRLVKAVKATEEQTYIRADGKEFAVFVSVSTPDVPYGNTFKVELLYKIMPGPKQSTGEESAHLLVSWALNFNQHTMMKGMIEGGARQGLKESFEQFSGLLSQFFKEVDSGDILDKNHVLNTLQTEHQSDWELAIEYFWNFTVVSTIFMVLYVSAHILVCGQNKLQGLEIHGFDLPDSFGEIVTCAILVIQLQRVYNMVSHFIEARLRRGSDHGIRAQGDGWVLTVALVEGMNLASPDPVGFPDPYVVFTCNGKTRTSSVQLQGLDPQWNEILEFDAAEEPPSVLDVEVFDFDGPFDQVHSLGHAEINFLKHTSTELADMWIPLEGKLAQSSQSKLHLRIFLDNNNGVETIKDYLTKMEKEVGKKLNLRSPHRNSAFQKIFGLPPEEFLISDFSCSLKRKLPLQGRLFLSARIVGFYANLFGHKTKFFFLWEDIEDIQVLPPSFATVGSPSLVVILRKDRGLDARHGAKSLDGEGRLHFHFHSFVSFNAASRTIMALWRTRTLDPELKAQIAKEQHDKDAKHVLQEDSDTNLPSEDAKMPKVYSAELPVSIKSLMQMFSGGDLEHKVMSKSGCLNYTTTNWETVSPDESERSISYKFSRHISVFGGEVTCTQQKSQIANDGGGWIVKETMALHGVPFSDHFHVLFKYHIEKSMLANNSCRCDVYVGVEWLKSTKFRQRITRNIVGKFTHRVKEILELVEKEILLANQ